jgi:peptidyl-prolyl cis-trans isomerase SurA
MMKHLLLITLVLIAAPGLTSTAGAERELIDQVVAVVDDEAIFESDVIMVMNQLMFQQGRTSLTDSERNELHDQVLKNLINDKLIIAQAKRLDIDIPFSVVEERVTQAVEENQRGLGGAEAFERQLEREGFTMESLKQLYRQQIRNRMLVEEVLRTEVDRGAIDITDDELRHFYEDNKDSFPDRPAVAHLKTIYVGFESSENVQSNARSRIDEVYERAVSGEAFADLAKTYSEDPSAPLGGDLGFVNPEDLADPVLAETVKGLGIGEISEPVKSALGFHVVQATERNPDNGEVRIRHILIRMTADDDEVAALFGESTRIREEVAAGASFEEMADKYSTDPNAGPGGDLGWLKVEDLPEFFQDVLSGMQPGDISQVLRESSGFRVVKLVAREEPRPYEFSEIRTELQKMYEEQKMEEIYKRYVEQLRGKFHVATYGQ